MNIVISLLTAAAIEIAGLLIVKKRFKDEIKYTAKKRNAFIIVTSVIFAALGVSVSIFADPKEWTLFSILRTLSIIYWTYFAAVADFKLKIIPNEIIIGMMAELVLIFIPEAICDFSEFKSTVVMSLLGGFIMGGIFLLARALSKGGMGMGDVKLVLMCGLFLGFENVVGMIFWALVLSIVTGAVLMITKKAKLKSKLPMGPFFFGGAVLGNAIYIISGLNGG